MAQCGRPGRSVEWARKQTTTKGSGMDRIEVSNDELKTVRDAMRELNRLVDALESGDSEKFVLCQNNRMRAVVISLDTFSQMRVPQPA
jgi:hypothetical protein